MENLLFVYGTLLKGESRNSVLSHSKYLGGGIINFHKLFDLGEYPGIKKISDDDSFVVGELYEIDDKILNHIDRIEGYYSTRIENSLFVREKVSIRLLSNGDYVNAYTYYYNNDSSPAHIINHGDYRRYKIELQNTSNNYFIIAYGSNLSIKRIKERIGAYKSCIKGHLTGYKLVFNKKASGKNYSYANIQYTGNDNCPCVAYELDSDQIQKLDSKEGVPYDYLRISIPFTDTKGDTYIYMAYVAHPNQLVIDLKPEKDYIQQLIQGYEDHDLVLPNDIGMLM